MRRLTIVDHGGYVVAKNGEREIAGPNVETVCARLAGLYGCVWEENINSGHDAAEAIDTMLGPKKEGSSGWIHEGPQSA